MFSRIRRFFRRLLAPKLSQLEIADTPLNRNSTFWWEARMRGDTVHRIGTGPDGLIDVMVTRTYAPGSSVTDDQGRVTTFPKGAQQPELVQGVNPIRFIEKA